METQSPSKKQKIREINTKVDSEGKKYLIPDVLLSIISKIETKTFTTNIKANNINNLPEEILLMILDNTDTYIFVAAIVCKQWLRISIDTRYFRLGLNPTVRYELSYIRFYEYADGEMDHIIPIEHIVNGPSIRAEDKGVLFLPDRMIIDKAYNLFRYMSPSISHYQPWWLPHLVYHNRLDILEYLKQLYDSKKRGDKEQRSLYDVFGDRSFLLAYLYAEALNYQDVIRFLATIFTDHLESSLEFEDLCIVKEIREKTETTDDCCEKKEETKSSQRYNYPVVIQHIKTSMHDLLKRDICEKMRQCYEGHIILFSFFKDMIQKCKPDGIDSLYYKAIHGDRIDMLEFFDSNGITPSDAFDISFNNARSLEMVEYIGKKLEGYTYDYGSYQKNIDKIAYSAVDNDAEDILGYCDKKWYTNPKYMKKIIEDGSPRLIAVMLKKNPACDAMIPVDHAARSYLDPEKYPKGIPRCYTPREDRMFVRSEEGFYMNVMM